MIQEFDLNKNKCHASLSHLLGCSYDTFFCATHTVYIQLGNFIYLFFRN